MLAKPTPCNMTKIEKIVVQFEVILIEFIDLRICCSTNTIPPILIKCFWNTPLLWELLLSSKVQKITFFYEPWMIAWVYQSDLKFQQWFKTSGQCQGHGKMMLQDIDKIMDIYMSQIKWVQIMAKLTFVIFSRKKTLLHIS